MSGCSQFQPPGIIHDHPGRSSWVKVELSSDETWQAKHPSAVTQWPPRSHACSVDPKDITSVFRANHCICTMLLDAASTIPVQIHTRSFEGLICNLWSLDSFSAGETEGHLADKFHLPNMCPTPCSNLCAQWGQISWDASTSGSDSQLFHHHVRWCSIYGAMNWISNLEGSRLKLNMFRLLTGPCLQRIHTTLHCASVYH